jgi:uncharacterized membrane protein YphA (DoxX/SURF4 family)
MNIALWAAQVVLAFAFIAAGGMKVFAYEKYKALSAKNRPMEITRGLVMFIGIAELLGAIGIVLPMAANLAPLLSPITAVRLAIILLLAVFYHVRRGESPAAAAGLLLLAIFVAVGRFSHWA